MILKHKTVFKELPLSKLELDGYQPRKEYGTEAEKEKLRSSITHFGLQDSIMVTQKDTDRYVIIDGHRRYLALKEWPSPQI